MAKAQEQKDTQFRGTAQAQPSDLPTAVLHHQTVGHYKPAEAQEPQDADAGDGPKGKPKRVKDTRRIVSGVQLPGHNATATGALRTFVEGDEDALEEVLSPGQHDRLKSLGAIEGDWSPQGQEPEPMAGSRDARLSGLSPHGSSHDTEAERLRREVAELKQKLADAQGGKGGTKTPG